MTTYSFVPNRINDSVTGAYAWSDPLNWSTNSVPVYANADVLIPTITRTNDGTVVDSTVEIESNEHYAINSLTIGINDLSIDGSLSVSGSLTVQSGGRIDVSDFSIDPLSTTLSVGSLTNDGTISRTAGTAHIFASSAMNTGAMAGVRLTTPAGDFANFSGGTLTGGSYDGVFFDIGGLITTDAADITNAVESYDAQSGQYIALQDTLRTIAPTGTLTISSTSDGRYTTSDLTVAGTLVSESPDFGQIFTAQQLTIASTGTMIANGEIIGAVEDDGVIKLAPTVQVYAPDVPNPASELSIYGSVTGSGTIEITPALPFEGSPYFPPELLSPEVELDGAASVAVVFDDPFGELKLDHPASFTGTIAPDATGDVVALSGIALSDVTDYSYSGDTSGGTLTIDEAGTSINLHFVGDYTTADFVLTASPLPFWNQPTRPPSTFVTVTQQPGDAFTVEGGQAPQSIVGTGSTNFINTGLVAGGTVDLANSCVSSNQFLARLANIQGVQLGADYWTVYGLGSGTDFIYGGSGTLNFTGEGASDVIQGGTGINLIYGGGIELGYGSNGTEIFYSNGGNDTMLGRAGTNFMQAGATSSSTDVFIDRGGTDFVYGGAGSTTVFGGTGTAALYAGTGTSEMIGLNHVGFADKTGTNVLHGGSGTDLFYAGIGTNLFYEGSGTDVLAGNAGADYIYGGSGRSFIYGGSGTDVITTGAGNQYVQAGSGHTYFNDTADNLTAGRFDQIDNFAGGLGTDLYLPTAIQAATSFAQQGGGTAILTAVGGGTAEIFAGGADLATVQAHTHFTL